MTGIRSQSRHGWSLLAIVFAMTASLVAAQVPEWPADELNPNESREWRVQLNQLLTADNPGNPGAVELRKTAYETGKAVVDDPRLDLAFAISLLGAEQDEVVLDHLERAGKLSQYRLAAANRILIHELIRQRLFRRLDAQLSTWLEAMKSEDLTNNTRQHLLETMGSVCGFSKQSDELQSSRSLKQMFETRTKEITESLEEADRRHFESGATEVEFLLFSQLDASPNPLVEKHRETITELNEERTENKSQREQIAAAAENLQREHSQFQGKIEADMTPLAKQHQTTLVQQQSTAVLVEQLQKARQLSRGQGAVKVQGVTLTAQQLQFELQKQTQLYGSLTQQRAVLEQKIQAGQVAKVKAQAAFEQQQATLQRQFKRLEDESLKLDRQRLNLAKRIESLLPQLSSVEKLEAVFPLNLEEVRMQLGE